MKKRINFHGVQKMGDDQMGKLKALDPRLLSTIGCSLFFAYILSVLFEGQVLYSLSASFAVETSVHLLIAMAAHLLVCFPVAIS